MPNLLKNNMTKIFSRIAIALLLILSFSTTQAQKFGHINSSDLLQTMPEVKKADSALQLYQKSLEDLNESMTKEYATKATDYQTNGATMNDAVRQVKEQELGDLEQRIQKFQAEAQDKFAGKKDELYTPIYKKAEDAIKEVAKENAIDYVFDTSMGGFIVSKESENIMDLVKKKLGIKIP